MTTPTTNDGKRPSDAVIEAARDLAKRLPSGQAEPVYHACIELRRLRKALAELDRQRAETCTARDDTPSKSRTKRIAIQRAETSEATESSIALAQDWARANAGEHADTIIEAAEARGYARAKVEGEADARDVVRLAFCIELGTVPEERPDQPKERRWSLTLYPNGWQVLVVHGSTYVECIDAAIEAAKPQRAAQQRKGG